MRQLKDQRGFRNEIYEYYKQHDLRNRRYGQLP